MNISIGLVDDHLLFSKSLTLLLKSFKRFVVVVDAVNGIDLQAKLRDCKILPQIMLIDVTMPKMDGIETAKWLRINYPKMKLVALSMNDKEQTIIEMLRAGCCSYLIKDTHPIELEAALNHIYEKGYYNSDTLHINYGKLLLDNPEEEVPQLVNREHEFLILACSDLTYNQIAVLMKLSERTIDGYRQSLFQKFKVQSRTGMVLEAIRNGLIKV